MDFFRKYKNEIKWSIFFSFMMIAWAVFERSMGWHTDQIANHPIYSMFFIIPAVAFYALALMEKKKKDFSGKMTWGQSFVSGLIMTSFIMLWAPLVQWIIHTVVSPDYFDTAIQNSVSIGKLNEEQARSFFSLKSYMIQAVFGASLMGILTSAVVSLFTQSK